MKIKMEFDPVEDKDKLILAMRGPKYYHALWDIAEKLFRKKRKYSEKREYDIEELEKEFYEILEENNIYDLIDELDSII